MLRDVEILPPDFQHAPVREDLPPLADADAAGGDHSARLVHPVGSWKNSGPRRRLTSDSGSSSPYAYSASWVRGRQLKEARVRMSAAMRTKAPTGSRSWLRSRVSNPAVVSRL